MGYDFFLSHSSKDIGLAQLVKQEAEAVGLSVYLAEHDVRPGEILAEKVKEAIRNSQAMITLLTNAAISSAYVQQEIGIAVGVNIPVVPIAVPGVDPRSLAMLQGREYIPLDAAEGPQGLVSLRRYLQRVKSEQRRKDLLTVIGLVGLAWFFGRGHTDPGAN